MDDARRSTSFDRLANMPEFELAEVRLAIGASDGQETELADGIERFIMIAPMRVLVW
jgi:hypothetical protein